MGNENNRDSNPLDKNMMVLAPMAPGEQEERQRLRQDEYTVYSEEIIEATHCCEERDTEKGQSPVIATPQESSRRPRKAIPIATRWCVCSVLLFWILTGLAYAAFWLLVIDRGEASREISGLFSTDELSLMQIQQPRNPKNLYCNPFTDPYCTLYPAPPFGTPPPSKEAVCGVKYLWTNLFTCPTEYSIRTYESKDYALELGVMLLHGGACGACSTTQDLSAQSEWDLSIVAQNCWKRSGAMYGLRKATIVECIMEEVPNQISPPCATLWSHFIREVMSECWRPCLFEDFMRNVVTGETQISEERSCRSCMMHQTDIMVAFEMFAGQTGFAFDDSHAVSDLNLNPCADRSTYSVPRISELRMDP